MRSLFYIFISLHVSTAYAGTYNFEPSQATKNQCQQLGMHGAFELQKYEDSTGYEMRFFDSERFLPLTRSRTDKNIYSKILRCQFGCTGGMEILLNFNLGTFQFERDFWWEDGSREYEYCSGRVE